MRGEFMYFSKGEDLVYKYVFGKSSWVVELFFPINKPVEYHVGGFIFSNEEEVAEFLDKHCV